MGADVVLQLAFGAAQTCWDRLLAFGGRFVEIGVTSTATLGSLFLLRRKSLYAVDLCCADSHPHTVRRLLKTVYHTVEGTRLPVPDHVHYPVSRRCAVAIRVWSATGTGKVVLDVPRTGEGGPWCPQVRTSRPTALISSPVVWARPRPALPGELAAAGCGRIVLNSRSTPARHQGHRWSPAPPVLISSGGNAVTSLPATAHRAVAVATAWVCRCAACRTRGGGRGRHGQCHHELIDAVGRRRYTARETPSGHHRRAATEWFCFLFSSASRPWWLAGSRRICGGQQLVGRFWLTGGGRRAFRLPHRLKAEITALPRWTLKAPAQRTPAEGARAFQTLAATTAGRTWLCPDYGKFHG